MLAPNLSRRLSWSERLRGRLDLTPPRARAGFLRDLQTPFFFGWSPVERDITTEYQMAYHEVGKRAIDAIQNSGWLAGGIEQATTQIVGPQLSLNARPDALAFNGDVAGAATWAREVERRFAAWARQPYACDMTGRQTLGQICAQAVKGWFAYGEILALINHKLMPGNTIGTKVQALPPPRLVDASQNQNAVQGIIMDVDGQPIRYCLSTYQPSNMQAWGAEVEVKARDETGRTIVVHVHDSPPTVVRGITPLAPALLVVRQFDQLANATLTAALLQAIFAATIESDAPTDQVLQALQDQDEQDVDAPATGGALDSLMRAKADWYQKTKVDLGVFGKLVHLFVGEKLNFLRSEHPNDTYKPFARFLLLEISKCLGITYEQMTGDREGATYSSERMGSAENWSIILHRRTHIASPLMQAAYESWLEENIELGVIAFPGGLDAFVAQRALACAADWRGPPKPSADEEKSAKSNAIKLENKIITREMWCADEGQDWEDVFEQTKREQDRAKELDVDLTPPKLAAKQVGEPGAQPGGGGGGTAQ